MTQLDLPLARPVNARADEFLVSESNARAVHILEHWATWPVMTALLVGPRKSGRSTLARLFVAKSGGTMIDDAQAVAEAELFHAWNRAQADHRPLLMVADHAPPEWQPRLADLRSRLAATPVLSLGPPDDSLVDQLLAYLFDRRELDARPDVIAWLAKRVERSHLAVLRAVDKLEEVADAKRSRRVTIPFARAALADGRVFGASYAKRGTDDA